MLSELKDVFGFSDADIHYLNAETEVSFCLYCKTAGVIIGGWKKGNFFGAGTADYSGLISMTKQQQVKLFETEKVNVASGLLLQKEKISRYTTQYPFKVDMPNTVVNGWLSIPFEKIHFNEVPFHFYPEERKSMMKQFTGLLNQISKIQSVKSNTKQSSSLMDDEQIEDELFYNWKSFALSDVCITGMELEKAKSYLSGDANNNNVIEHKSVGEKSIEKSLPLKPITQVISTRPERESDFNSLLTKIVLSDQYISAKDVWSILEREVKLQANERKFDQYNILKKIVADELFWESRYGNSGIQKFSSINTTVSRAKKKLKTV